MKPSARPPDPAFPDLANAAPLLTGARLSRHCERPDQTIRAFSLDPTILALLPNSIWARYLAPGQDITGLFVPGPFANYVEVGVGGGGLERGVMHEYAHCFLHTQFGGLVPLWFDEGIAQFAAATTFNGDIATIGEMRRTMVYTPGMGGWWPKDTDWMPMVTLLGLDGYSRIYRDTERSYTVHKQAWVMVHRGLAAELGLRLRAAGARRVRRRRVPA